MSDRKVFPGSWLFIQGKTWYSQYTNLLASKRDSIFAMIAVLEQPMTQEIEHQASEKLVLLVEDDVDIGEVLLEVISQETPYHALLKTDGQEALAAVQSQKPDLFILDYHLPRMTGIELYDQLHAIESLSAVPALMISARLPVQELKKRNIMGMNKPIDLDDFLQTIEHFLAQ